jgi:hypothetical protein
MKAIKTIPKKATGRIMSKYTNEIMLAFRKAPSQLLL